MSLAGNIQKYLVADTGLTARGIKTANYYVLVHTNMPAVLVETGFIDNRSDSAYLAGETGQDTIASAIAKGVADYLGTALSLPPKQEETEEAKMIYNYIDGNMPQWARPTIQKLVDKGYLKGNEKGELELTDDLMRMLVINDRAGIYGD